MRAVGAGNWDEYVRPAGHNHRGPPSAARSITVAAVQVTPDGRRLAHLVRLLAAGVVTIEVGARRRLDDAVDALAGVRHGTHGAAVGLQPV